MDSLRKWFTFSRGERIAVVSVSVCIVALALVVLFRPAKVSIDDASLHNLDSLLALRQAAVEEMHQRQAQTQEVVELHPFPFNPNTMTEEDGLRMGLTDRQMRNIINYREKGGKFYSKNDLAKLYTISEDDFAQLEPFIVLPETSRREYPRKAAQAKETQETAKEIKSSKTIPIVDLNTADSALLVELPKIGGYTAARIVAFRDKLGGFLNMEQLLDVKGMDAVRLEAVKPYLTVGTTELKPIDVNRADFRALVNHPYLNYEQVKRIVNQREKRGMVRDWAQLQSLIGEAGDVNPLLEHYVKF